MPTGAEFTLSLAAGVIPALTDTFVTADVSRGHLAALENPNLPAVAARPRAGLLK